MMSRRLAPRPCEAAGARGREPVGRAARDDDDYDEDQAGPAAASLGEGGGGGRGGARIGQKGRRQASGTPQMASSPLRAALELGPERGRNGRVHELDVRANLGRALAAGDDARDRGVRERELERGRRELHAVARARGRRARVPRAHARGRGS